jgi:hypothetical protein
MNRDIVVRADLMRLLVRVDGDNENVTEKLPVVRECQFEDVAVFD